ncbi:ABC transporter permease [Natrarchaeobius oligotrophus]|uniref:ABC transporter permease n=1 Tax=Natrarchaeobius chitinivorans TaxID=1679083 RepID=A0A3N6M3M3_NATCH|nr:ABC transporter permease [Natrarchaeobius chitinivorans]RQG95054.1 ABC transporter permease [Natrarchaeobius chitinivorans]
MQALIDKLHQTFDHPLFKNIRAGFRIILNNKATRIYFSIIVIILLLGLFGPAVAPYEANEITRDDNGDIQRSEAPSSEHLLGTTERGEDVLSQVLIGARPTVASGILGGGLIITLGLGIGLTSGYVGGRTENVLMRITDLFYGIPMIPTAIILVAFFGIGYFSSILIIGLILWRSSARVIRSQVLQIKEQPFVKSAETAGASTRYVIIRHILPNVGSMAVLFLALGIGSTIIVQAGLAFIGVTNPYIPSWGVMIRNAYDSGLMAVAWWWSIPPGLLIAISVMSTFMFGRSYEQLSGQTDNEIVGWEGQ